MPNIKNILLHIISTWKDFLIRSMKLSLCWTCIVFMQSISWGRGGGGQVFKAAFCHWDNTIAKSILDGKGFVARNLEAGALIQELKHRLWGILLTGLLTGSHPATLLVQLRPTVCWTHLHQLAGKCPHRHTHGPICLRQLYSWGSLFHGVSRWQPK